ncbi:lysosomal cobalamin transporter-related [Anaeramoeba flamelloides]|uniref:Lysosomal cobalamin transporter-related n=1 Tax=Anaeramoeba flamelloides TaxID=1746091 RepID=A0ABQ8YL02_9EUKA|nr:lysosomal cobalamin transporter-related [Anaeramoeba flamelloides]
MMVYGLTWLFFGIFSLVCLLISIFIVFYYSHKTEGEKLTKVVSILSLFLPMIVFCVVPLDIYSLDGKTDRETSLKVVYYLIFSLILVLSFILIPFAIFFFEAEDEDTTTKKKVISALKFTACTVVIVVILLLVGLLVQPGSVPSDQKNEEWVTDLFGNENRGDSMLLFPISCMSFLGVLLFLLYMPVGFGLTPVSMIKKGDEGTKFGSEQSNKDLTRKEALETKQMISGKTLSKKEKKELDTLTKKSRLLEHDREKQEEKPQSGKMNKVIGCLSISERIFGVIFIIISLFILACFMTSLIEKLISSKCGWRCGFLLNEPSKNPFDLALLAMSKAFPVDMIFLSIISVYFLLTALSGIVRWQPRILCFKLWRLKGRRSDDQAILITALYLLLITIMVLFEYHSIAPQYTTFGNQKNKAGKLCTLDDVGAYDGYCRMSEISTIFARISVKMPFFAILYYASDWLFVILTIIYMIMAIKMKKKSSFAGNEDSDDDF